jgi:tricarballylate dehydrogenase
VSDVFDVIVVGGGNAGYCAAHAARAEGASVLLLEKAPRDLAGGNTFFTAGAFRFPHGGLEDLLPMLSAEDQERAARVELEPYPRSSFQADLERLTQGRCDPELARTVVDEAPATLRWLAGRGIGFTLLYERQSYVIDERWRFWGGLSVGSVGEGPGLVEAHQRIAEAEEVQVRWDAPVRAVISDEGGAVTGVVHGSHGSTAVRATAVVLAAGGFQADASMRAAYLGPNWDLAKVRGTPTNTGEVLRMACSLGARPSGHWSGCHSVAWDAEAPASGDRELTNLHTKQSYPLGIVVNRHGARFVDEGADFRNYTYARYGAEILRQPGAVAFQLFDAKTAPILRRGEYDSPRTTRHEARSIRDLAEQIGIVPAALSATVQKFNAAVGPEEFNPTIRDGKAAKGLEPPKSNWAQALDEPPFLVFPVTCGITFTFGGVAIDTHGRVLDQSNNPIKGLYAAGEMVGGLFFHNYPGGSGLTAGAVFGRRAGQAAAADSR